MLTGVATDRSATEAPARRYRTIFISDLHLGTRGCKADCLLDFLRHVESDYLYLVGDIVDGWRLQKRWFWPDKHAEVLDRLLARAREGTEVVYLPGNHDEALRRLIGRSVRRRQDPARHDPSYGRRPPPAGGARRRVRRRGGRHALARPGRIGRLRSRIDRQHVAQRRAPLARARVLAPVRVPQGAGQGGGQVHRPVRALTRRARRDGAACVA